MNRRHLLQSAFALAALSAALPLPAQIRPPDAAEPVKVLQPRGEFAKKLNGTVMPSGKGWKAATDQEKRLQLMLPAKWKVVSTPAGDTVLEAYPPGHEKDPKAVLMVIFTFPRNADPLEVEEPFAASYADDLADDPMLKRMQFKPSDSGFVLARGMKFALAGGTMTPNGKELFQQQQLLYISEDRIVTIQFTASQKEYARHAQDLAGIFASYVTLGVRKLTDD